MRALRIIAIVLLSCLGIGGATAAVLWAGSLAGLARGDIVTTSAMAPDYRAGDLVIVTRTPVAQLRAGDVVSVVGGTGASRLERVVATDAVAEGSWSVATAPSAEGVVSEHRVGDEAWAPSLRVPVVGGLVAGAVEPGYAIPGAALVLLLGAIALIGRAPAAAPARRAA